MMDLRGIRDLVASLFIMLNQKTYILFRVEFLVVVVTVLFLAMFIMDIFRRHFHSTIMKAIFSLFDAVSDSILIYLMGTMQTAPFENELFPVWSLVLIIFRYSVGFISGYGVLDPGGRRFMELRNVMNLLATAFLSRRHGSRFQLPLWSLLGLQMLRSFYRFILRNLVSRRIWLGWSSEVISEYMRDPSKWEPEDCNPGTMYGYRYLVYGERYKIQKPRYGMSVVNDNWTSIRRSSLITLDKIWLCRRHLLRSSHDPNLLEADDIQRNELKDLCLAFALSRLIRCRLEDVTLQGNIRRINRKLAKMRMIEESNAKRSFGIMELQLAFVNDYFNTRYPMVFWYGLGSLSLSLLQSVMTIGVVCWLSVAIRKVYKPQDGEVVHLVRGFNVEMIITWVFMFFVMFKEIWEMVTYLLSDWTRLLLVCKYASQEYEAVRNRCMERLILFFFRSKINAKRWHGHLDQYIFVESYDDRPKFWNLIHKVTTGMVPKKDDGEKLGSAIDVPECVQPAILEKLRAILDLDQPASQGREEPQADAHKGCKEPANTDDSCLPPVIMTLCEGSGHRIDRYGWACFNLQTSSHVILVWHIATSVCEMALAKELGVDLSNPRFLRSSLVSCFTDCWSSKTYLIDVDKQKEDEYTEDLRKRYIIANSFSRYCAYLLVSKPDLIPDSFLVPKMVFQATMRSARDKILKGCDTLESRYNMLKEVAGRAAQDSDNIKKGDDVVKQGALLAKELLDHESQQGCWEILAGVWTEFLVHIAPTWNAEAHRACLESGGEFITNIWSLLWHCGIEKSSLWPEDDASEDDSLAPPQDNDTGNNHNISPAEETQQASSDTSNHPIGTEIHEESETEATEEPEAARLRIGPRGVLEGTGSSEIEEASHDATGDDTNV